MCLLALAGERALTCLKADIALDTGRRFRLCARPSVAPAFDPQAGFDRRGAVKGRNVPSRGAPMGPSQRQLRAGELVRHALVEVLREEEIHDDAMAGVSVTLTEVRMSPDLRHAHCFVVPLGGGHVREMVSALNRHSKFLRGALARRIVMKFTPDLRFLHDESFETAERIGRLFDDPRVRADLQAPSDDASDETP